MRLSNQLNLYPKKVYKWHWDRKKRLNTGAFEDDENMEKNYEPDSGASILASRQDSDLKLLEQSKSDEGAKSSVINFKSTKEEEDQDVTESSKEDELVSQDMKDDLIWN